MKKSRYIYPLITIMSILGIGEYFFIELSKQRLQDQQQYLNSISNTVDNLVQTKIIQGISATSMLEASLRLENYETTNFESWAKDILIIDKSIDHVQLAPNALIEMTFPLKGQENTIGYNLLADPKIRKGVLKSIEGGKITVIGPSKLEGSNRMSIVIRKPVFQGEEFWGFSTALIDVDRMAKNLFQSMEKSGLKYSLYGDNSNSPFSALILQSDIPPKKKQDKAFIISVPNGKWHLFLEYKKSDYAINKWFHLSLIFSSLFIGMVVYRHEKRSYFQDRELSIEINNKEILFRELYHRVKNNLQIISGLLSLQTLHLKEEESKTLINETNQRIKSMAMIHEKLYKSEDLSFVDMQDYTQDMVSELRQSFQREHLKFDVACESIKLSLEVAVPMGLIINELVTNAIKYAFNESQKDQTISVKMYTVEETLILEIFDNGKGVDIMKVKEGFGSELVEALAQYQLKAKVESYNENGLHYKMTFPKELMV